jgi:phosphohistidine phosphatase
MSMNLYIMRHGEALPTGGAIQEDAQRPLSALGKTQVQGVAEGLRRRRLQLTAVFSSPLVRAQETAQIIAQVMNMAPPTASAALAPNASPAGLSALLASQNSAQSILWVAHHPDVTVWTAFLAGLDSSVCPIFGTASIAALQLEPSKKKAEFLWFQTSEQLAQK